MLISWIFSLIDRFAKTIKNDLNYIFYHFFVNFNSRILLIAQMNVFGYSTREWTSVQSIKSNWGNFKLFLDEFLPHSNTKNIFSHLLTKLRNHIWTEHGTRINYATPINLKLPREEFYHRYFITLKLRIHRVPYTYSVSNESLETCLQLYKERTLFIQRQIIQRTLRSERCFVGRNMSTCHNI